MTYRFRCHLALLGLFAGVWRAACWGETSALNQAVAEQAGPRLQIVVPAYFYPGGKGLAYWEQLFGSAAQAPIIAIVNVANGPGKEAETHYAALVERAKQCNLVLIGYVYSSYTKRPLPEVMKDVDAWRRFYPGIQGIFVDEQTDGEEQVEYYLQLYRYIRQTLGLKLAVTNPGARCAEGFFARQAADVICLYESPGGRAGAVAPDWAAKYPATGILALPYAIKTAKQMRQWVEAAARGQCGYIYVTDDSGDNPWDRLPSYWRQEVEAVRKVNAEAGYPERPRARK